MKILILGGSGMLGHRLFLELSQAHETWMTVRGDGSELWRLALYSETAVFKQDKMITFVDVAAEYSRTRQDLIRMAICMVKPDVVLNCIGLIKQRPEANDPVKMISINALFPHMVAAVCREKGIRFIQVSTDCVFSGKKGYYSEKDEADPVDVYGRTKLLGEVGGDNPHPMDGKPSPQPSPEGRGGEGALTIRTSLVGRELRNNLGLLEWFLAQKGSVKGYSRAIFSGVTTVEFARMLLDYVLPDADLCGLYHVASEAISKFELLKLFARAFGKDIEIVEDDAVRVDRSLNGERFRLRTGYEAPSWEEMIEGIAPPQPSPIASDWRGGKE